MEKNWPGDENKYVEQNIKMIVFWSRFKNDIHDPGQFLCRNYVIVSDTFTEQ